MAARSKKLTHLGGRGEAHMVDVSAKEPTEREAVAEGRVVMTRQTLDIVRKGDAKKGDVLGVARIAGDAGEGERGALPGILMVDFGH